MERLLRDGPPINLFNQGAVDGTWLSVDPQQRVDQVSAWLPFPGELRDIWVAGLSCLRDGWYQRLASRRLALGQRIRLA